MFGISGQNMNFEDRKWIADWHAALGINHVCPHLALYSMKGCRKRNFPPTLSPQQPYWAYNKPVEDHMARVSYATTVGRYAPELLLIHPLESQYLDFPAKRLDQSHTTDFVWQSELNTKYYAVLETLQRAHRDYDLGDEQILADVGAVEGNSLRVGKMSYQAVVLPPMDTIRPTTLGLLENFAAAGGAVLAVERLPELVDAQPDEQGIARLAKIARVVQPAELASALAAVLPPAVRLEGKGAEDVWIHRRTVDGGQIVLLTNTSRLKTADCALYLADRGARPAVWDPSGANGTGLCRSLRGRKDGSFALRLRGGPDDDRHYRFGLQAGQVPRRVQARHPWPAGAGAGRPVGRAAAG